jgi:hypothetical protein
LTAALLLAPSYPARAAENYTITITKSGADTSRGMIFEYHSAGEADEFSHKVRVLNRDDSAYSVRLKKIEVTKDSALLDRLAFSFAGLSGGEEFAFSKADFGKTDWPELYAAAGKSEGGFMLKTKVGALSNKYQGLSCTVRFTFELVNLHPGREPGDPPNTGADSGAYLILWCSALAAASGTLLFLFFWKRRGRDEEEKA